MTLTQEGPAPAVRGDVAPGFEAVADAFAENLSVRHDLGASFAAVVDGEPVVDLWGGVADRATGRPWAHDTLVPIFSGSKGMTATAFALLIDRGQIDLDAPVTSYWPEFGAAGKGDVLVHHVASHLAGLPGLTTPVTNEEAGDGVRMAALLAQQPAIDAPGERLRYHALTYGWLCGELVRRVDGRSVGRVFAEDVAAPLGLEAWLGLPPEQEPRVAVLERGIGFDLATEPFGGPGTPDEVAWSVVGNPPRFSSQPMAANTPSWHAAEIPATSGIVTARALARLYGCLALGGELDGVRLLSPATIELTRRKRSEGVDPVLGGLMAFGIGFAVQTDDGALGPPAEAFGCGGSGGSLHGAWPQLGTGFSYAMNEMRSSRTADSRAAALLDALHACVVARPRR